MPTSDEFREIAEQYSRLAREAKTETDRLSLLDLACTWLDAASRQDEMTPEQIVEAQKLERARQPKPETSQPQTPSGWRQRVLRIFH